MDILQEYKRYLKLGRKSQASIYQYMNDIKLYKKVTGKSFIEASVKDTECFLEGLIEKGNENTTLLRKIASLRSFYSFCRLKNLIKENPLSDIPKFRIREKELKVLSKNEIQVILETLEYYPETLAGKEINRIFRIMYFLAMRVSEIRNLNISDIHIQQDSYVTFIGKSNKKRSLPLVNASLLDSLISWLSFRKRFSGEALFITRNQKRVSVRTIQRWIRELGKKAGLEDSLSPHMLRRTLATHLSDMGVDIAFIGDLLSHKNLNTTRRYAKISDKKRREVLSLL
ncbi:MAG: tyrosine-type recombinase/integrase [Candidatus Aureabacteria bacterium]|nr:tyrosine-type recombinase/integrase [Candidatus Auribacterota bacterium]